MKLVGTITRVDIYNYLKKLLMDIDSENHFNQTSETDVVENMHSGKIQAEGTESRKKHDVESLLKVTSDHDILRRLLAFDAKEDDVR
jgi:hypothetical protein